MMFVYWKKTYILTKNAGALLDSSELVVLETNTADTKYVIMHREQNAEENHNVNIGNKFRAFSSFG
jgi:hypothetical protein